MYFFTSLEDKKQKRYLKKYQKNMLVMLLLK